MVDLVCILCRGTYQPYCRSLPEDPLVECFEITDESNITGLFLLATENICMTSWQVNNFFLFMLTYVESSCTLRKDLNVMNHAYNACLCYHMALILETHGLTIKWQTHGI